MSIERLLAAAKAYLVVSELRRVESQTLQASLNDSNKRERLEDAISDAEQQAVDDVLPITPEWIAANFRHMGEQYSAYQHRDLPQLVWLSRFERLTLWDNPLPQIKNLGQLRKLVAALKGGE